MIMLIGLFGLNNVRDVTGTMLGGGSADLFSAYTTFFAFLLFWAGISFRLRGAQSLLGSLLLIGCGITAHSLYTYPSQAEDLSISIVYSPNTDNLTTTLVICIALLILVTLHSPRTRRWLRLKLWRRRIKFLIHHNVFKWFYLAFSSFALLIGWAIKLHMAYVFNAGDWPISSIENFYFFMTMLGLLLFGIGMAFRWHKARWALVGTLLLGIALSIFSFLTLQPSMASTPTAFAPTSEELKSIFWRSVVLLLLVFFSAPIFRQSWRRWTKCLKI
ncbi:hypothetical protein ACIGHN_10125 [Acidovorax sp. NPDC077693]|uniref:hypothetical protein n=1 Tax=unclassified Acidovorax TaxID=2684926 RepID=UPI0037CB04E7